MNPALALRRDQSGMLNREDETIEILSQKYILHSTDGNSSFHGPPCRHSKWYPDDYSN